MLSSSIFAQLRPGRWEYGRSGWAKDGTQIKVNPTQVYKQVGTPRTSKKQTANERESEWASWVAARLAGWGALYKIGGQFPSIKLP